jgi:hypothetical protein
MELDSGVDPEAKRSRDHKNTFFTLLFFSVLEIGALVFYDDLRRGWFGLVLWGGAIFFPIMTVFSWLSMHNDWSGDEEGKAIQNTLIWLIGVPILLGAFIAVGWGLSWVLGWPLWASVIVLLLLAVFIVLILK